MKEEKRRSEAAKEILRERLQECRKKKGISASVVSELCGLSHEQIARYESGEQEPKASALAAIADFYEVSVDWLLGNK